METGATDTRGVCVNLVPIIFLEMCSLTLGLLEISTYQSVTILFSPPPPRIAYIEFKSEAEAEKALEEKQGAEIEGRSIILDYIGEKSQQDGKKSSKGTQPGKRAFLQGNHGLPGFGARKWPLL